MAAYPTQELSNQIMEHVAGSSDDRWNHPGVDLGSAIGCLNVARTRPELLPRTSLECCRAFSLATPNRQLFADLVRQRQPRPQTKPEPQAQLPPPPLQ